MGVVILEGKCLAISGYEENYLDFIEGEDTAAGICGLVTSAAGLDSPEWRYMTAFEFPGDDHWQPLIEEYRRESGRHYPPVYKVRIVVEAEPVSPDEERAYWEGVQQKWESVRRA